MSSIKARLARLVARAQSIDAASLTVRSIALAVLGPDPTLFDRLRGAMRMPEAAAREFFRECASADADAEALASMTPDEQARYQGDRFRAATPGKPQERPQEAPGKPGPAQT